MFEEIVVSLFLLSSLGFVDNDGPYNRVRFNFYFCTFYFLTCRPLGFLVLVSW